ncbi:MAG: PilZ domain-containing protein [Lachnospiraceae bacterium]|nr:PilZ domain-containing protein [Lachnospiraceae bacterium]
MYLREIPPDTSITLSVGIGVKVLEFNTKVAQVFDTCIYTTPIMQQDKMVGFNTKGLVLSIIVPAEEEGKAFQFMNVKVRNVKTPEGELYHEISTFNEGKVINRRGACRVWLGNDGIASIGLGGEPVDITVKDISTTGISFICSDKIELKDNTVVHLSFRDPDTGTKFEIGAIVVRKQEMDRGRVLYGCKLNQESNAISKYINDKQREKLKRARQGAVIPIK